MIRFHAATLARQPAGVLIDKLERSIALGNGRIREPLSDASAISGAIKHSNLMTPASGSNGHGAVTRKERTGAGEDACPPGSRGWAKAQRPARPGAGHIGILPGRCRRWLVAFSYTLSGCQTLTQLRQGLAPIGSPSPVPGRASPRAQTTQEAAGIRAREDARPPGTTSRHHGPAMIRRAFEEESCRGVTRPVARRDGRTR